MVREDAFIFLGERVERLGRVPSQRAFWFGWNAQFPDNRLVLTVIHSHRLIRPRNPQFAVVDEFF